MRNDSGQAPQFARLDRSAQCEMLFLRCPLIADR